MKESDYMKLSYPAMYYRDDETKLYVLRFIDFNSNTVTATTFVDLMRLAKDTLYLKLNDYFMIDEKPPMPSTMVLNSDKNKVCECESGEDCECVKETMVMVSLFTISENFSDYVI